MTAPTTARPTTRLDSLTGLRFVAALAVFAHHITVLLPDTGFRHVESTMRVGPSGVSFFFVLSGFVLCWSRRDDDTSRAFLRRRFARIWPAHAVTWLAGLVFVYVSAHTLFVKSAALNLALLQSWVPRRSWFLSVNVVSWSLADEWFFYLAFGALMVVVARLSPPRAAVAAGIVAATSVALDVVLQTSLGSHADLREFFMYIFPPTRLLEFVLGMCLARALPALPPLPLRPVLALAGASMLAAAMVPEPLRWTGVTLVPFAAVIVAAAQTDLRGDRTLWATPTMVRLGAWSFAFYLVHQLVIRAVDEAFPYTASTAVGTAIVLGVFAVAMVLAAALHTLVEVPAERALRTRRA